MSQPYVYEKEEGVLLSRSFCGHTCAGHGALEHFSGAGAVGSPRTALSSLPPSSCAHGYQAAPPPGNLEHIMCTNEYSWHRERSHNDRYEKTFINTSRQCSQQNLQVMVGSVYILYMGVFGTAG